MSGAADIVMYSTAWCGYCQRARNLFERKGLAFREIKVDEDMRDRETMVQKSGGRRTEPQIFIREHHVGRFQALEAL
jgi:glutaredoxin 3